MSGFCPIGQEPELAPKELGLLMLNVHHLDLLPALLSPPQRVHAPPISQTPERNVLRNVCGWNGVTPAFYPNLR